MHTYAIMQSNVIPMLKLKKRDLKTQNMKSTITSQKKYKNKNEVHDTHITLSKIKEHETNDY